MNIHIYKDDNIDVNIDGVVQGLTSYATSLNFLAQTKQSFTIKNAIRIPQSYDEIEQNLLQEARTADLSIFATKTPYENNYFFESSDNILLVSFYAWDQLTSLPINNGLVYFIADILYEHLPISNRHDETTGCINDLLWDKRGIDLGMRSGHICESCRKKLRNKKLNKQEMSILNIVEMIIKDLTAASRNEEDIVNYWKLKYQESSQTEQGFDVFLCHNSQDKEEVRKINDKLKKHGVRPWLDEEQLRPGFAWQVVLEEQIASIKSSAVFAGTSGIGPWQNMEMRAFLSEFIRRQCPVIPVILPNATVVPELPIFLRQLTWVDFRGEKDNAISRLVWGITGRNPVS